MPRFHRLQLHSSEKADESFVNPDHVVSVTPDPRGRWMTVVLSVFDAGGWSWSAKTYRVTVESGSEFLAAVGT